jgi:hypothetical protein
VELQPKHGIRISQRNVSESLWRHPTVKCSHQTLLWNQFPELNSLFITPKVCDVRKIGEHFFSLLLLLLLLLLLVLPTNSANLCPCSFIVRKRDFVTNDNIKEADWKDVELYACGSE